MARYVGPLLALEEGFSLWLWLFPPSCKQTPFLLLILSLFWYKVLNLVGLIINPNNFEIDQKSERKKSRKKIFKKSKTKNPIIFFFIIQKSPTKPTNPKNVE